MCGICGIAYRDPERPADLSIIRRMAGVMRHRGPDGDGYFVAPGIGLGARRLAIIDVETGDQPLASEDGAVAVICNGEIYNYLELRRELIARGHRFRSASDVEVVVHLYEELGDGVVQRLRGMFAFALWDGRRQRLLLARDRLGIKPLYYCLTADGLCFGSEIKAILASGVQPRLDPAALAEFVALGYAFSSGTFFDGVCCLPPGHLLSYRAGTTSASAYWDLRFPAPGEGPRYKASEWAEALAAKLEETICLHLRSDVPLGGWLSPGIDSSTVMALAGRLVGRPVRTFTLTFEDRRLDEAGRTATLDRFAGYDLSGHRVLCRTDDLALLPEALWHAETPSASGIEIVRLLMSQAAAEEVKVVLSGEGGDEVLGGYPYYWNDATLRRLGSLPLGLPRLLALAAQAAGRPRAASLLTAPATANVSRFQALSGPGGIMAQMGLLAPQLRAEMPPLPALEGRLRLPPELPGWHSLAQLQYLEIKTRLPAYINHIVDRESMARSLEARVPFLDHELVELCAAIPPSLKLHGREEKHILRRAVRGLLPHEIVRRRKRGLGAPAASWLRGPLPEFADYLLSPGALHRKGYFAPEAVATSLAQLRAGKRECGVELMQVLSLQLWDEIFLQRRWGGP